MRVHSAYCLQNHCSEFSPINTEGTLESWWPSATMFEQMLKQLSRCQKQKQLSRCSVETDSTDCGWPVVVTVEAAIMGKGETYLESVRRETPNSLKLRRHVDCPRNMPRKHQHPAPSSDRIAGCAFWASSEIPGCQKLRTPSKLGIWFLVRVLFEGSSSHTRLKTCLSPPR